MHSSMFPGKLPSQLVISSRGQTIKQTDVRLGEFLHFELQDSSSCCQLPLEHQCLYIVFTYTIVMSKCRQLKLDCYLLIYTLTKF